MESDEAIELLGVVANRLTHRMTGARWQRQTVAALEKSCSRQEALRRMLSDYLALSDGGTPVHEWPLR